ncbi:MAG: Rne/Rng family ribonuclease [Beijerinckiaceae bacterium]
MSNNKMLIDASHPEETRVVVLRGNRIEEFDFESASKKPLRGNIYLAKVTRVEPSLQAAFVDYGGNRHGFLAFSEIHPDYYQIPVADRLALLEEEAREQREEAAEEENRSNRRSRRRRGGRPARRSAKGDDSISADAITNGEEPDEAEAGEQAQAGDLHTAGDSDGTGFATQPDMETTAPGGQPATPDASERPDIESAPEPAHDAAASEATASQEPSSGDSVTEAAPYEPASERIAPYAVQSAAPDAQPDTAPEESAAPADGGVAEISGEGNPVAQGEAIDDYAGDEAGEDENEDEDEDEDDEAGDDDGDDEAVDEEEEGVEQLGGDSEEDMPRAARRSRRQYKIQEVIKRRQIMLIQVVKEERGNKGAALTTYLSLAGRYSVLMPNTARGGGISRKITDGDDRRRMKEIAQELEVPDGMGVILRTAGASRTKPEVKRDFEYLLRLWESVREMTLRSTAPTLVYEEGSLIKRSIRDLYGREIDEVVVAGEEGHREARDFMRMLMPSHTKNVKLWREQSPVFAKSGVEQQLDALFSPAVTLKSGGYIVINQTEALVAIDVNSGRSTREHNIEDTALRTNLEAADEIARQLRLRDLAGLIVVDFIDMEEHRNNRSVERRLKEALKNDRARIQVGRISHFGLLEMSRQRMRTGVLEGSSIICPHCQGAGTIRSTASIALHVLRLIEDALVRNNSFNLTVKTRSEVALYILNQKRANLADLERRFGVTLTIDADDRMTGTTYHAIERGEPATAPVLPAPQALQFSSPADEDTEDEAGSEDDTAETVDAEVDAENIASSSDDDSADEENQRRRRRRRRRGRGDRAPSGISAEAPQPSDDGLAFMAEARNAPLPGAEQRPSGDENESGDEGQNSAREEDGDIAARDDESRGGRRRRGFRRRRRGGDDNGAEGETGNSEDTATDLPSANPRTGGSWVKSADESGSSANGTSSGETVDLSGPMNGNEASAAGAPVTDAAVAPEQVTPDFAGLSEIAQAGPERHGEAPPDTTVSMAIAPAVPETPVEEPAPEPRAAAPAPEPLPEAPPPTVKRTGWWSRIKS